MSDVYSDINDDDNGVLWSTTAVSANAYAVYSGTYTLLPNTRYYWSVRVWDVINDTSPYIAIQTFDTNFFLNKQVFVPYDAAGETAFAVGDINGDGLRDFIQADYSSFTVTAFTNNGNDSFTNNWQSNTENYSRSLALAT